MSEGLHTSVLDTLGREITAGELVAGSVLTLERLQQRFGVSRTVARECMRLLEQLQLVTSGRRVGIVVRPTEEWDVLDPRIIRWRLGGPGRSAQLRSLNELRVAVEPLAASAAARHATDAQRAELVVIAGRMRAAGEARLSEEYLALDVAFHTAVLRASGNEMFAALTDVFAEVLVGRTHEGQAQREPGTESLDGHDAVAHAILIGDADEAERVMREIMTAARAHIRDLNGF
ncbi:FadR/GntR family transcriptional regulator [Pengzhenrongella frigida]|uniref:FadR family transcriptional regulator n=1 Tax=Pengzhenrongella frigida TaxID=1259133 RepID=A0A4Q5N2X1_9MICO|nr:FCD domain-containing protein [Cellulomonas sp. HLT2-17]RYV51603.1 FadR family transcriptional regulator [Cellulomonas sp. HLT2-17]